MPTYTFLSWIKKKNQAVPCRPHFCLETPSCFPFSCRHSALGEESPPTVSGSQEEPGFPDVESGAPEISSRRHSCLPAIAPPPWSCSLPGFPLLTHVSLQHPPPKKTSSPMSLCKAITQRIFSHPNLSLPQTDVPRWPRARPKARLPCDLAAHVS